MKIINLSSTPKEERWELFKEAQELILKQEKRIEDIELLIGMLSKKFDTILESKNEAPAIQPRPQTVTYGPAEPGKREPRPINDGTKFWTDEYGNSVKAEDIPDKIRAKFMQPQIEPDHAENAD